MIEMSHITKSFPSPERKEQVTVLSELSLSVRKGEFVAIMGESGAGKSTLMNLIGTMDLPDRGSYTLAGVDVLSLSGSRLSSFRSKTVAFIFQHAGLIEALTAFENVRLPLQLRHLPAKEQIDRAEEALACMKLSDRKKHLPGQLSGGQKQRVAIARAIACDPEVILADEPTGALDQRSAKQVMKALQTLHQRGKTILLITHDPAVAAYADRICYLYDGKLHQKNGDRLGSPFDLEI